MPFAPRAVAGLALSLLMLGTSTGAEAVAASATAIGQNRTTYERDTSSTVPGSYIVTLKDAATHADSAEGRAIAEKYGATIKRTYRTAINGYSIRASETQVKRLAADSAVKAVTQNRTLHAEGGRGSQPTPPSWGLDRIDQKSLPLDRSYTYPKNAGKTVTAYVIDSGVRITHQDFGGRASYGYDAVDHDNIAQDDNGHGTHVAATVAGKKYGVAKNAKIVAVRVLDGLAKGTTEQIVAGIDWVTQHAAKPAVANISITGGADPVVDQAVQRSIASGITYVVAAGNDNKDAAGYSPARVREAITVGATTKGDARYELSNYGSTVDIFAPGSSITSAWGSSDRAFLADSGTSMAAPHVAGAVALYLAGHPSAPPSRVASALTAAATTGAVTDTHGSPNRLLNIAPRQK
ncbi:putative peptidase S8 family protein [Streptomyces sp. NBRC 110611]|uniref:S8 family peptidase n=1 Tax=Streptomyces sp. NBRC 110611 TaxID=1621259 RepID=UPI000829CD17|nr:putative peptidase S8 family protein [Streptomyces sp. NBRC 110611]